MILAPALAVCAFAQQVVPPREVPLAEVRAAFPERWEFPRADAEGRPLPSARFEARVERLASEPLGEASLGDLVRACADANWDPDAVRARIAEVRDALDEEQAALLEELLLCDGILDPRWRPSKERRNGLALGPTWELPEGYWSEHGGSRSVEQAATLILADLRAIKVAEHDYPAYFEFPDNEYLEIVPRRGRYLRAEVEGEDEGCPAAFVDVYIESDLPFPFTRYSYDLAILHAARSGEDLITYVYGRGEDLHWLAGYDRFWTVRDGDGAPVATLLVRQLAIDVDGVPDRSSHRRDGMRAALGNLRRASERRFDGDWAPQPGDASGVPKFRVIAPAGRSD